jgi:DNA-binding LacI/PurR family transcriptional regulator
MTPTDMKPKARYRRPQALVIEEARRVEVELDRRIDELQPGDRLPNHTVLMQELQASERTVLRTLDSLLQAGRIVRRQKAGTFVAERTPDRPATTEDRSNASRTVVAIARPDHGFFSHSVDMLYKLAKASNLSVMFQPIGACADFVIPPLSGAFAPYAYIVLGSALIQLGERLVDAGHRAVALGDIDTGQRAGVATVHADSVQGGFLAANHLISLGHRRLIFAGREPIFAKSPRWEGHMRAIAEAQTDGVSIENAMIDGATTNEWHANPKSVIEFFKNSDSPTGICCWNDHDAIKLMRGLLAAGICIPEDVSVVGYDNLMDGQSFSPQLTTLDPNLSQQLRTALRLVSQDTSPSPSVEVILSPTLIPRLSTRAVGSADL